MATVVEGLKPPLVWKYFVEVARIPRCSKHEAGISKYVAGTAKKLGLAVKTDKFGNVVVKKPASAGKEHLKSVALQGHLDMVCEKNKDTTHNFEKDPIEIVRKGNVLMADGTTLGADNGIAVATNRWTRKRVSRARATSLPDSSKAKHSSISIRKRKGPCMWAAPGAETPWRAGSSPAKCHPRNTSAR
jgi:hypothetical protein